MYLWGLPDLYSKRQGVEIKDTMRALTPFPAILFRARCFFS